jgi:DNA-directed RNA polymerase specialized sigma24 family protein
MVRARKIMPGREPPPDGLEAEDADHAMASLYQAHYRPLVQLAALLVTDVATAEDIVQESFVAVHGSWHMLPDTGTGALLSHLRRSVILRSRSATRLPVAGDMPAPRRPFNDHQAGPPRPESAVIAALRALPARQREVMVLRYFAELPEAEIASATGMSLAAVRSYAARAMEALHSGLRPAEG